MLFQACCGALTEEGIRFTVVIGATGERMAEGPDPFADRVVSFEPGEFRFGSVPPAPGDELRALGEPDAAHVPLGLGGVITLEFVDNDVIDGPGADLQVNAFLPGGEGQELDNHAEVLVSFDGLEFVAWALISQGGPSFLLDLGGAGMAQARFVRIRDSGLCCLSGNPEGGGTGFNVESVKALNTSLPGPPVALVEQGRELYLNVPDNAAPQALWCSQCHTIEGVAQGLIGPDHTHIGTWAGDVIPGMSAEEYIRDSIEAPEAFIEEGRDRATPGLMTDAITRDLTTEQVDALVSFLLAQK